MIIVSAAVLVVAGAGLIINSYNRTEPKPKVAIQSSSKACKNTDVICQQEAKFRDLTRQAGVAGAFTELRAEYAKDESVRSNCHPITHVIGRTAGETFNTVSAAYAEGDEFCWSGYYHGVMEAMLSKIDTDELVSQLDTICADMRAEQKFSFDHYNCVHGLGHGVMLVSGHELFDSLKSCDVLSDEWEKQSCYSGVFMENVMANINPSHTTKYIKADQPLYPCTAVDDTYKNQCYLMQTSQALTSLGGDFQKVFALCGGIEEQYRETCYQSLGRDASGRSISNVPQTRQTCLLGRNDVAVSNCIIGAAKDFVSYYHSDVQATELCNSMDLNYQSVCLSTTKDYYKTF